jgi:hypothetical protein
VLEAVKVWPGKGEACRKVGATANLHSFCAPRRQRCAGRDEETNIEIKSRRKKLRGPGEFLTKKAPNKGPGADSEEKREPVSNIDTTGGYLESGFEAARTQDGAGLRACSACAASGFRPTRRMLHIG